MAVPILEVLIGTIASGKTTYSKFRAAQGAVIVNRDDLVASLHAGVHTHYDPSLRVLYYEMENKAVICGLHSGRDVVLDRTNIDLEHRRRGIFLGHAAGARVMAVTLPFMDPKVHARRRWQHDNRGYKLKYWQDVANRLQEQYLQPTPEEGFDEVREVTRQALRFIQNDEWPWCVGCRRYIGPDVARCSSCKTERPKPRRVHLPA